MPLSKPSKSRLPKVSAADKAKAAKVRATLPPKNVSDSDVTDMAKSLAAFSAEVAKARHF